MRRGRPVAIINFSTPTRRAETELYPTELILLNTVTVFVWGHGASGQEAGGLKLTLWFVIVGNVQWKTSSVMPDRGWNLGQQIEVQCWSQLVCIKQIPVKCIWGTNSSEGQNTVPVLKRFPLQIRICVICPGAT